MRHGAARRTHAVDAPKWAYASGTAPAPTRSVSNLKENDQCSRPSPRSSSLLEHFSSWSHIRPRRVVGYQRGHRRIRSQRLRARRNPRPLRSHRVCRRRRRSHLIRRLRDRPQLLERRRLRRHRQRFRRRHHQARDRPQHLDNRRPRRRCPRRPRRQDSHRPRPQDSHRVRRQARRARAPSHHRP